VFATEFAAVRVIRGKTGQVAQGQRTTECEICHLVFSEKFSTISATGGNASNCENCRQFSLQSTTFEMLLEFAANRLSGPAFEARDMPSHSRFSGIHEKHI
jgi:hypothetical protein